MERYELAVASNDTKVAAALVDEMLGAGAEPVSVLTDVIAAAQREVGARWERGEWTVAQEHAATAMAVAATGSVMKHVRRTPTHRGRVVIACAEREWHALPAMIIDCALRADGWDTTLLGASTSPLRLNQYLQDLGPEAVAVSCSMLGALSTTRRFIEASTAAGVPIMVGGAAFGRDDRRARALGATAWARDAQGAVAAMKDLPAFVPPARPLPAHSAGEQAALELDHRRLVTALRSRWSLTAVPGGGPSSAALVAIDDVLNQVLYAVSAALLTDDPRPVSETSAWITELMQTRGVSGERIRELGDLVAAALADFPEARELVSRHFVSGPA